MRRNMTNEDARKLENRFRLLRAAALLVLGVPALVAYLSMGSAEVPVDEEAAALALTEATVEELCDAYCSNNEPTDYCLEVCTEE